MPHKTLQKQDIENIVRIPLFGTAKLFHEKHYGFEYTINRVAIKGGATEVGVGVLVKGLPIIFNDMFEKTLERQISRILQ